MEVPKLLPVENFIGYGLWVQQQVAPDLDTRTVIRVEPLDDGFRLVLEDGDTFFAQRVVMATGLLGHEHRPAQFEGLAARAGQSFLRAHLLRTLPRQAGSRDRPRPERLQEVGRPAA